MCIRDRFTVQKAVARLKKGFKPDDKVIILVKYPKTVLMLIKRGIQFGHLNICLLYTSFHIEVTVRVHLHVGGPAFVVSRIIQNITYRMFLFAVEISGLVQMLSLIHIYRHQSLQ